MTSQAPWQAKSGCPWPLIPVVERALNALPVTWLAKPATGEVFDNFDACMKRLQGFALAEGFVVVGRGGGTKKVPSKRYICIHHGTKSRNYRKLEDRVEKDPESKK